MSIGEESRFDADRLEVSVCRTGDTEARATVTIFGFHDDAVRDVRHELTLAFDRGFWAVEGDVGTQRCRPGRGPQEFSSRLCS